MAWNSSIVLFSKPHIMANTVTTLVKPHGAPEWWMTGVYGPQTDAEKRDFMQELIDIRELHAGPWIVVGDFNLLVNPEDKNWNVTNRTMMT